MKMSQPRVPDANEISTGKMGGPTEDSGGKQKTRIPQSDVPAMSLSQATRLARAIGEHYAYKPTSPLRLAQALKVQPNSGGFRMLCGASSAYGFTKGTWNSPEVALEPLGLSYVRPLVEGEDDKALREALLRPRVVGEFLRKYHNAPLPRGDIAKNVLLDMKVPPDRAEEVLSLILQGAQDVGFIRVINGRQYLDLDTASAVPVLQVEAAEPAAESRYYEEASVPPEEKIAEAPTISVDTKLPAQNRKVFITHGKNRSLVDLIKRFLTYAEMEPVVLVEQETVAQPVPEKVMEAMRSCSAAVIHVDADQKLIDAEGKETVMLNPNVMIEVGAAMALYGRRFILLVKEGITLPSNLQGLYEVRYSGDSLDGNAVMKLLDALSDLKKRPLP